MDNQKATILIISNDNTDTKTYKVDVKHLRNFKKYVYILSGSIGFLLLVMFVLLTVVQLQFSHANSLNSIISFKDSKYEKYESGKVDEKFNELNSRFETVNNYLQSRGVYIDHHADNPDNDITNKINSLNENSILLHNTLENIPVGYPYGGNVSSGYGNRRNPFGGYSGEFHPGIDFKGPYGDEIFATGNGVIERCDWYNGYGNAVVINHGFGLQTLYGHMTKVNVVKGQEVKAGDVIGFIGSTGRSTGSHLHYEVRRFGDDIDPVPFLKIN